MKKLFKIIVATLCAAVMAVPLFATACDMSNDDPDKGNNKEPEHVHVDYVSQLKLDFDSNTKKQEVTVRLFVDGDTTHFNPVSNSTIKGCNNAADFSTATAPTKGYAKARYLGINTPESTGQIEAWGKAASKFTKEKLSNATSWIIESDDENWNIDSTGERYLLWVWYLPKDGTEYRNLNVEILQAGLAYASGIPDTRYEEYAQAAIDQAEIEKLYVFSGEKDPDYHYGGPINTDLRELRFNPEAYESKKIRVTGLVTANFNSTAYIEETYYDIEGYEKEGITIGMPVYYSYTKGKVVDVILQPGNYVSVVGVLQFYETGGYYQITDIKTYDSYKPVENCEIIESTGLGNAFSALDAEKFTSTEPSVSVQILKIDDEGKESYETVSYTYRDAIAGISVSLTDLTVDRTSTTINEDSNSKGAFTLYCKTADGIEITIRTEVLKDKSGTYVVDEDGIVKADNFNGKKISVKGVIEYFKPQSAMVGNYQIKCHRLDYLTIIG